ncbi:lytic transglycosylase domain-containing protein [Marinobacterium nitratireducens]|uniref:lytic transglycosylase domain-containing protein n=1 Tax=Marinobacterium nitratireducens TaxID=518897 RepID=UPI001E5B8F92|nr:lytic transglycosylase domain-containing protein [Marinobacterium nitratireducens]
MEYTNVGSSAAGEKVSIGAAGGAIYKYRKQDGVLTFTDVKPVGREFEIVKVECYACNPTSSVNWHNTRLNLTAYNAAVEVAARSHSVDPALVRAMIHAESAFNSTAVSKKGAQGLMQLMPATAAELGVTNALDVQQNIDGGVRYLAGLLKRFGGDTRLAVAAYNAGPGAVQKYGGVPPYAETRVYVQRVAILRDRYRNAGIRF